MLLANLDIKKVWFRVQRVGRGTSQEPVCVMVDGKEYGFTMNRKNADKAIAIYQAKLSALKMASSLRGKLMLTDHMPHGCTFSFTLPLSEVILNE